jgi:hypothetical protein
MFTLDSEQALVDSFRPKDRGRLELPAGVKWPMFVRNYFAWTHPAGGRVFLVFSVPGGVATGVVFDQQASAGTTQMCHWCHQSHGDVVLLTAKHTSKTTVGVYVCGDLSCQQRLEDEADRAGRSPLPAWAALLGRIGQFASDGLSIDLSGAGR